jgi:hypothetical protein
MRAAPAMLAAALLAGCALAPPEELLSSTEVVRTLSRESGERVQVARFSGRRAGDPLPDHWQPYIVLPSKPRTVYRLVAVEGRSGGAGVALEANADRSASGVVRRIRIDPHAHPRLEWRWRVSNLIPGADKRQASSEDAPARLFVSFHGDPKKLDFEDRTQLRFARALSGQALPYATLMYVWSNTIPVGTVLAHPRTDRIRMIVVASGQQGVGEWRDYQRNLLEDYRRAFQEEPWDVVAIGLMTDADNTGQKARCHYGDIALSRID